MALILPSAFYQEAASGDSTSTMPLPVTIMTKSSLLTSILLASVASRDFTRGISDDAGMEMHKSDGLVFLIWIFEIWLKAGSRVRRACL